MHRKKLLIKVYAQEEITHKSACHGRNYPCKSLPWELITKFVNEVIAHKRVCRGRNYTQYHLPGKELHTI